jgi:sulfur-oxidizing protein SoxA
MISGAARAAFVSGIGAVILVLVGYAGTAAADSTIEADRLAFSNYHLERFPSVKPDDFVLGVYAINDKLRDQYDAINEFPPYEFAIDEGAELIEQPFSNGSFLLDCLDLDARGVNEYPYFDSTSGEIITLAVAINACRERNGEMPLDYRRGTMTKILARLNFGARGSRRKIGELGDMRAKMAYERGRAFFYTKRGQLNLSCADCHLQAVGRHLREQTLAPLLGAINHYPVYGLSWGALGSLHQRFVGCLEQVRSEPFPPQHPAYRELEYFLAAMSNGLPMAGPGIHR